MSYTVAIVGRPNVGKSTLFNRLTGSQDAIVDAVSGVTRDRHYGNCFWGDKNFILVDTGGYANGTDDVFEEDIRKQVRFAIEEANAIIFMVDVTTGITDLDEEVTHLLRKSKKPIFLVVNKVDNSNRLMESPIFYSFGFKQLYSLSAINGSGTGELLDDLVAPIQTEAEVEIEEENDLPKFTVVGRPNVGKSSLINVLTGMERAIVNPLAGTTRDSIDQHYHSYGFDFILVDTAGLRKKSKVSEDLEFYSVMRTIKAIERSDICVLMIDASEGIQAQDINILHLIEKNSKGLVLVVNKWDLVEKDDKTSLKYEEIIRHKTAPFVDYPIVFTSIPEKQRIHKVLEMTTLVHQNRKKRIKTSELNDDLLPILKNSPPPTTKGKQISIKYITQIPSKYPSFAVFCNLPQYIAESYRRFVENKIRDMYDFSGSPVRVYFRKS